MFRKLILIFVGILDIFWFLSLFGEFFDGSGKLVDWLIILIQIVIGLFMTIVIATYFHEKENRINKKMRNRALFQIDSKFVYLFLHITKVQSILDEYYNKNKEIKACEYHIKSMDYASKLLEQTLILHSNYIDAEIISGLQFLINVIEKDRIEFNHPELDKEKIRELVNVSEYTKKRLSKYNPKFLETCEKDLKEFQEKISSFKPSSKIALNFVWKENVID